MDFPPRFHRPVAIALVVLTYTISLFAFPAQPALAAISITNIGTNSGQGVTVVSVTTGTIPAGSLIVVEVFEAYAGPTGIGTVTDTAGNSYVVKTTLNVNTGNYFGVFEVYNSKALSSGNSITYTLNNSPDTANVSAFYATGALATSDPYDSAVLATVTNGSGSPSALQSGTPSVAGELFVAAMATRAGGNSEPNDFIQDSGHGWAAPPNYTEINPNGSTLGPYYADAGGSQVNSGTGELTFTPTVNFSAGTTFAEAILGFEPAPVPAAAVARPSMLEIWGGFFRQRGGSIIIR
jgi:hypothetical protein